MRSIAIVLFSLTACAYVLPASWRSFHADPDDAPPAITRALETHHLAVANWDQAAHKIVTGWNQVHSGTVLIRERYIVTWEREDSEGSLTVYVRHEAQDRDDSEGRPTWSTTYHSSDKEGVLLDAISKELVAMNEAAQPPPILEEEKSQASN